MKKISSIISVQLMLFIVAPALFSPTYAQWIRRPDAQKTRSEVTSVVYNSKLYTFLGFANSYLETEPSLEVYDPSTNTWKLLASIPASASVTHQGVVLIDSTVWHIGGRVGKNPGPLTSDIWIYNITTNTWRRGPQLKDPATGQPLLWAAGGAALLGRTLHIVGGFVINACNNDQSTYHLTLNVDSWLADTSKPAHWQNNLTPLPVKRNHFSTVVLGGKIYVIGGQFGHDCNGGLDKQYAHVYNPPTDTWTQLPLLPSPRSHTEGGTFALDGKIFIVAGQGANGVSTNKVTIFDPAGNNGAGTWKDDSSLTLLSSYEGVSAKVIRNIFIYSHGGQGASKNTRKETYSRTIQRKPVYKLGFSSGCLSLTADAGKTAKGQTLLFTIDSSKSYKTSSSVPWLTLTKNATGIAIPTAVDIEITANTTGLAPGKYNGTITATGTGSGIAYSSASYCVNLTVTATNAALDTLEAETAILSGAKIANNITGFSGSGFADYINPSTDYTEWTISTTTAAATTAKIQYANGSTIDRPLKLEVNNTVVSSSLSFPPTGAWTKWSSIPITINLKAGINTVRLTAIGSSGPNVDFIAFPKKTITSSARSIESYNIPTYSAELKARVIPNPANDHVQVQLLSSSSLPLELEVFDLQGRKINNIQFLNRSANAIEFSVAELPAGSYVFRMKQGNGWCVGKFVVNNKRLQ